MFNDYGKVKLKVKLLSVVTVTLPF